MGTATPGGPASAWRRLFIIGCVLALLAGACQDDKKRFEGRPPERIVAAAAKALAGASSSHRVNRLINRSGPFENEVWTTTRGVVGSATGTKEEKPYSFEFALVDGREYVKGRGFFDLTDRDAVAGAVGDEWISLPTGFLVNFSDTQSPRDMAECLLAAYSYPGVKLRRTGTTTVQGRRAVVVVTKRIKPGYFPTRLLVATEPPHYPLVDEQTGPVTPGGARAEVSTCGGPIDDVYIRDARVEYSDFGKPVDVAAPVAFRDFKDLAK